MVANLRLAGRHEQYGQSQLSPHSSLHSLFSIASSPNSSSVSLAETLAERDDEETRAVRRYILRKIQAGTAGAVEDLDTIHEWLRILKEVVHGVKRRAYL